MSYKSIEIYYDIDNIPGLTDRGPFSVAALDFRNRAMDHIEHALVTAGIGEWEGAEIGSGEVNFGFSVEDFDQAEAVVRQAIAGTEFEGIREVQRREIQEEDLMTDEDVSDLAKQPLHLKILTLLMLPFVFARLAINLIAFFFSQALKRFK